MTTILADRSDRPEHFVTAKETAHMRFERGKRALSLRAGKAFHLLVKHAGENVTADKKHKIDLTDLREIANLSHDQAAALFYELQRTLVEITYMEAMTAQVLDKNNVNINFVEMVKSGPLLDHVERPKKGDRGIITFRFSEVLREVFKNSEHWAVISRRAVMAFESRYSLRLFELMSVRINLEHKSSELFNLDDLRIYFGVPEDTLLTWDNFKRRALEPAITEINHLAHFKVDYEPVKHGRSVTGVKISWKIKEPDGLKAAKKELDGSKIGRKARRDGTVETVIEPPKALPLPGFPPVGSISYSRWAELVRQHAPKPTPDIDRVASAFRTWAASKGIAFDHAGIEKTFIGFCKKQKNAP